jgi:hypothetical protein
VLIYKFNNKPIRVCVPLHSINAKIAKNNARTVVLTLEDWFFLLKSSFDAPKEAA